MKLEERNKLRGYLRRGDIKKIAEIAKVDRTSVIAWFKGRVKNSVVEGYVISFVAKRKEEVERLVNAEMSN